MTIQFSVDEMFANFGATYKTVDVRSATIWKDNKWNSVYTVIRFSYEESSIAEIRLRELEARHGIVRTQNFQILLGQIPYSDWEDFHLGLCSGGMDLQGADVLLSNPLRLSEARASIQQGYHYVRAFDSFSWPVANYSFFQHISWPLLDESVARQVAKLGYSSAHEAVSLLCEINTQAGQSNEFQVSVSLPVFASIARLRIAPQERKAHVELKRHRNLTGLKGTIILRDGGDNAGQRSKFRIPIDLAVENVDEGKILTAVGSAVLPELLMDDWAEAQILHPDLGEIHHLSNRVRSLIPPAERNILFEALKFFCPENTFEQLLVRPFDKKSPRLKESAAFELYVAWLLGLLGLSTIVLGEYEKILAPGTKVERGTTDILAASQSRRKLVLVACTIGTPNDHDFSHLLTTAEILAREVYADTTVRIQPLVCTAAPGYPQCKEIVEGLTAIPVLDADRLAVVLKLLSEGRESDFFAFLNDPINSLLQQAEFGF